MELLFFNTSILQYPISTLPWAKPRNFQHRRQTVLTIKAQKIRQKGKKQNIDVKQNMDGRKRIKEEKQKPDGCKRLKEEKQKRRKKKGEVEEEKKEETEY